MPISERRWVGMSLASSPAMRSVPVICVVSPMMVRISVVLPTPLRPSTAMHWPSATPRLTFWRIGVLP